MRKNMFIIFYSLFSVITQAQLTTNISLGTNIVNTGTIVNIPNGFFINNGNYTNFASPGLFNVEGGVTFNGSGTTHLYNLSFNNSGTSLINTLISIDNTATIGSGTTVDINNNLWIRSDLNAGANLVVYGILTGALLGSKTNATVSMGPCPSYSTTLSHNISGSVVLYQWQSSEDSINWTNINGAVNSTYIASVSKPFYYRCSVSTSNSSFINSTPSIPLLMSNGKFLNVPDNKNYCNLQDAVNATTTIDGETISISSGTYTSCSTIDKSIILTPSSGSVILNCIVLDGINKIVEMGGDLYIKSLTLTNGKISTNGHRLSCDTVSNGHSGSYIITD